MENSINLFDQDYQQVIKGITIEYECITKQYEIELINYINRRTWNNQISRKTQHFGYRYDYRRKALDLTSKIPEYLYYLMVDLDIYDEDYDQIIINRYTAGEGINPHIDNINLFGPVIIVLSLGQDCIYNMSLNNKSVNILIPRRSVLIMQNEARYKWKHSLKLSKDCCGTRYSITFRTVIK